MLKQNTTGCFCAVLHFLNGAYLFKMVRKALSKNNQASSTDGMRSKSFQDIRARAIRKACSLKGYREHLTVMKGGHLTADPLRTQAVIAEILVENSRGVFRGQIGQDDIYEGAPCLRI